MENSSLPLVSVIIPTYNRAWSLQRSITSVFEQKKASIEIIVVDDGSSDNTKEVIEGLKKQCPSHINFDYEKQEQKGVSAARNKAARKASGDFLAFLDSDDEWLPEKTLKQVTYLQENPDIPLVHGEETWVRRGRRVNPKKKHQKSGGRIFQNSLKLCLISPSCSMIRKEKYWELGGFDEDFTVCEDYDLWLKLTSRYEVGYIEDPLIIKYGGHEDQLSTKYRAMDYWRVISMWSLINNRDTPLSIEDQKACLEEILFKSDILIQGYRKHGNLDHLEEIERIYQQSRKALITDNR